jgi:hypothetical protein
MKIEREYQPRSTIEDFADENGLVMQIRERPQSLQCHGRFIASFKDCEEKGDGVLIGTYGNGQSEWQAIEDYARKISGKVLAHQPSNKKRRDLRVPILESQR